MVSLVGSLKIFLGVSLYCSKYYLFLYRPRKKSWLEVAGTEVQGFTNGTAWSFRTEYCGIDTGIAKGKETEAKIERLMAVRL